MSPRRKGRDHTAVVDAEAGKHRYDAMHDRGHTTGATAELEPQDIARAIAYVLRRVPIEDRCDVLAALGLEVPA